MGTRFATEHQVYQALQKTFEPPAYAVLPGVANGTGGHKRRTIDALVMGCWPSRGLLLHGVEIKTRRGDVVRELKNPAKQEAHFRFCDRFWLAVGDAAIVKPEEVPETWGLLVPARSRLKIVKPAPELTPEPPSRPFLAAILRRAEQHIRDPETVEAIKREGVDDYEEKLKSEYERGKRDASHRLVELEKLIGHIETFERASGLTRWSGEFEWERMGRICRTLRGSGAEHFTDRFVRMRDQAVGLQAAIDAAIEKLGADV